MQRLKKVIGNGLPFGLSFFILCLIIGYTFHLPQKYTITLSLVTGGLSLIINGLISGRFSKSHKQLQSISIISDINDPILLEAQANHTIDDETVVGKLVLTHKKLIFKAYNPPEFPEQLFSYMRADITECNFYGSLWNAGGEFLIKTKDQNFSAFEVDNIKPWKAALQRK